LKREVQCEEEERVFKRKRKKNERMYMRENKSQWTAERSVREIKCVPGGGRRQAALKWLLFEDLEIFIIQVLALKKT